MDVSHLIVCYDQADAAQRSWALGLAKVPQTHFRFMIKLRAPEFNGGRRKPLQVFEEGDVRCRRGLIRGLGSYFFPPAL